MSIPVVVFPDVQMVVVDYLTDALADRIEHYVFGVKVGTVVERPRQPVAVTIERAGGVRTLPSVDNPRVEIQVWHGTDEDAQLLALLVRALLHAMPGVVDTSTGPVTVTRVVDFAGPFRSPDPLSKPPHPRVRLTVEVGVHPVADTTVS
jgi:hypothetical protein